MARAEKARNPSADVSRNTGGAHDMEIKEHPGETIETTLAELIKDIGAISRGNIAVTEHFERHDAIPKTEIDGSAGVNGHHILISRSTSAGGESESIIKHTEIMGVATSALDQEHRRTNAKNP